MAGSPERSRGVVSIALVVDAPRHLAAQVAGHKGLGLAVFQVEKVGPVAAADLQDVAEPLAGDERDLGALSLGDGIDDDRRPVHKRDELVRGELCWPR